MYVYESKPVAIHLYSINQIVPWTLALTGYDLRTMAKVKRTGGRRAPSPGVRRDRRRGLGLWEALGYCTLSPVLTLRSVWVVTVLGGGKCYLVTAKFVCLK